MQEIAPLLLSYPIFHPSRADFDVRNFQNRSTRFTEANFLVLKSTYPKELRQNINQMYILAILLLIGCLCGDFRADAAYLKKNFELRPSSFTFDQFNQEISRLLCKSNEFVKSIKLKWKAISNHRSIGNDGESETDKVFVKNILRQNDEALQVLKSLLDGKKVWTLVGEKQGVKVERIFLSPGLFVSPEDAKKGEKHVCVKSSAVLNATPEQVFKLFLDNSRAREYNEHIAVVKDIKHIKSGTDKKNWSKIAWALSPKYGVFKARDFFSVVNYRVYPDGQYIILNRPAYLSSHPPSPNYVRATILLAGNIIKPYGKNRSHVTLIAHVNPGGGADSKAAAWFINQLCGNYKSLTS